MKKVVIRVSGNYSLDSACAAILKLYGFLTNYKAYRSFKTFSLECPEQYESGLLDKLNALNVVKKAFWDKLAYSSGAVSAEGAEVQTSGEVVAQATTNTRNITGSSTNTIYVKVVSNWQSSGSNVFAFSTDGGSTYAVTSFFSGFLQGATYVFDQSDPTNNTHPIRFSTTPDGSYTTGGVEFSSGVTYNGVAGSSGANTTVVFGSSTPSVLYYYCLNHSGMGRYDTSPNRYGTLNVHDFWHLDRLTKQDRQYMNGQYSNSGQTGDGVDIYILDSGVRGASRPTGNNAALHPELYDPDFVTDLNGTAEQQNYRVYQLPHYAGDYGTNNEDDNDHGTYCAILAAGRTCGFASNAKIYALKCLNSSGSGTYTAILNAYQAVIDHNDSGNANYKGNTRPAIVNTSIGSGLPSQSYPYVELNDAGDDTGTDEEVLDDIEGTIAASQKILICRSAGNGFKDSGDNFAGPLMSKVVVGARTAGYADNTTGGVNNVDVDQAKISVGASDYNDRWADFSNYGAGATVCAPGKNIRLPKYDWTANTPYTSTANYATIGGTSFSCPLVAGIMACWAGKNGYTLTTNNFATLGKQFIRGTGNTGDITKGVTQLYPTNSIEERKLPTNPYTVTSGSNNIVISFNSSDNSHFIGNVGKKVQLRTTGSTEGGGSNALTYNITTTAPSFSFYTLSGTDRNGGVSGNNVGVTVYVGDTINFNLSGVSGSHPFYLKSVQGTGTTNQVSTPAATGQGSTGTATVSWTPNTAGTYYYQCSNHNAMNGTITVQNDPSAGGVVLGGTDISALSQGGWLNITAEDSINNTVTVQSAGNASATATGGGSNNYLALINSEAITHESTDGVVSTSTQLRSQTDAQEAQGTSVYDNVKYYPVDSGVDFKYDANTDVLTKKRGAFFPYVDTNVTWAQSAGAITGSPFTNGASVSIDLGLSGQTFASEPTYELYTTTGDALGASGLSLNTTTGVLSGTVTSDYIDTTFNFSVVEQITNNTRAFNFTTAGTGVLITVTGQPSSTTIEAGAGTNATFGPVSAISSDGSTITYQWEVSTDGGSNWSALSEGSGYTNVTSNTLTVNDDYGKNAYQFRCKLDTNTAVASAYTNAVTLTVIRVITISAQPTNATPVAPATGTFNVTAAVADGAALSYQWEKSENGDGASYADIGSATTSSYTTGATTYDADYGDYYRVKLNCTGAAQVTSNAVRLFVTRTINITTQPQGTTGAVGGTRTFNVVANTSDNDSGDITYQWQISNTGGASWSNVSAGTGGTTATYVTPTLDASYDANQFRCVLSCTGATQIASNAVTLQVETVTVNVVNQPQDTTVNETATATFSCTGSVTMSIIGGNAASSSYDSESWTTPGGGGGSENAQSQSDHSPNVSFQWQKSDDGGANWANVGGATSSSYTTAGTVYATDNADQYRCELDAVGATVKAYTNAVTLTVQRTFSITAQPSNVTSNEGATSNFTISASTSSGTPTYQWQKSDDGGANYANVSTGTGGTTDSYTTGTLIFADDNNDRFQCIVSLVGSAAPITSGFALQTVLRVITISQQPQNTAVIEGQTASFSVTAAITSGSITYQWQISTDSGANWSAINGANSASYTTPATTYPTNPSEQFRCVLSNANATSVTSTAATLTVNESEFVSAPTTVTPFIDPDTTKTLSREPVITTSAFVQEYAGSTHSSSYWRIRRVSDNVTVYDTNNINVNGDSANKTSLTVPAGVLEFDTQYSVQVKFRDQNSLQSAYSTASSFTTPFVDQPDIQTITPAFNPTVTALTAQVKSGFQHTSTFWQFSPAVTFTNIVHESRDNSVNKLSYTLPNAVTLSANTLYYVRIRFNVNPV